MTEDGPVRHKGEANFYPPRFQQTVSRLDRRWLDARRRYHAVTTIGGLSWITPCAVAGG